MRGLRAGTRPQGPGAPQVVRASARISTDVNLLLQRQPTIIFLSYPTQIYRIALSIAKSVSLYVTWCQFYR